MADRGTKEKISRRIKGFYFYTPHEIGIQLLYNQEDCLDEILDDKDLQIEICCKGIEDNKDAIIEEITTRIKSKEIPLLVRPLWENKVVDMEDIRADI